MFQLSILTEYCCILQMWTTIICNWLGEFTLQQGSNSVQVLFNYLFFGFKVNKSSKTLGQALFLHLNMRHKILKMFFSYTLNASVSLK